MDSLCISYPHLLLTNNTFTRLMNQVLKPFIRKLTIVNLDNTLILTQFNEEYLGHANQVLESIKTNKWKINIKKFTFLQEEFILSFSIISKEGLQLDPKEKKSIKDRPIPRCTCEVGIFHGLTSFYQNFIRNFIGICAPHLEPSNEYYQQKIILKH